jgi:selenocysteine-specific elongation factor
MHVLGTAGHVDHGKSSLVRALTGTNPDRWIEEQLRGMTLDLGFAHLKFPDGVEAGIVDVPGHERFLHNMLAGAAGMELLLLVVAANEGPRPQTIEHLAILQYLNVRKTIVVLTKSDTVDAEELAFAEELTRETLRGTLAHDARYVPVSVLSGAGLDELRQAIHDALVALPARAPDAPAYLPIDRVFALPGHGTIVTGTLMQGRIALGDGLRLEPSGRDVRVRSLQIFGSKRERASGGSRLAVNLPGVETHEIARGTVLASPQFVTRTSVAVRFRALPAAVPMLKRRSPVRVYLGSAEIIGTLVFERVPEDATETRAVLHLREPAVVFPGAAFVVRRLSPKTLLGGGTIAALDVARDARPPGLDDRARAGDFAEAHGGDFAEAHAGDSAEAHAGDTPEVLAVRAALHAAGIAGSNAANCGAVANVREGLAAEILDRLVGDGRVLRLQKPAAYIDASVANDLYGRARDRLETLEHDTPWVLGTTALALSRALAIPEPALTRVLAAIVDEGRLAFRSGYYATPEFVPALSAEQQAFFAAVFVADPAAPFVPVAFDDVLVAIRSAKITGLSLAFDTLLGSGAVVKVHDALYRGAQLAEIRAKLELALRRDNQIAMSGFRDLIGTSRKYAVPLLEFFDATGVTIRTGDYRVLKNLRTKTS